MADNTTTNASGAGALTDPAVTPNTNGPVAVKDDAARADATPSSQSDEAPVSANDRVLSPQIKVEGGTATITHLHLLGIGVAIGLGEDVGQLTSFPPSLVRTLVIQTKDQRGRLNLATLLEGIAGQLRGV